MNDAFLLAICAAILWPNQSGAASVRQISSGNSDSAGVSDVVVAWVSNDPTPKTENFPNCGSGVTAQITIKDEAGTAAQYPITIVAASGNTMDLSAIYVLNSNFGSATLQCDDVSNWLVL